MDKLTFEFTPQEIDIIYAALQSGPYNQVAPVVRSIEAQVNAHNDGLKMEPPEDEPEEPADS